jgi:hypothetical protein
MSQCTSQDCDRRFVVAATRRPRYFQQVFPCLTDARGEISKDKKRYVKRRKR